MRSRTWAVGMLVVMVAITAGCGGGPDTDNTTAQFGTLEGTVDLAGSSPDDYDLFLDGTPTGTPLGADGSFVLLDVPTGEHAVDVISNDGLESGRATVIVERGRRAQIPNPIIIRSAGQICGMVVKRENGVVEPLPGVQVIARSDLIWILTDDGARLEPSDAPAGPLIYPPPPGVTYSAFTDEDGSYRMKGVRPGPYFVMVVVPGLTRGQAYVVVRPYRTAVADFVLVPVVPPPVGTVTGTVRGESSAGDEMPLAGASVTIVYENGWRPPVPAEPVPVIGSAANELAAGGGPLAPPDIIWRVFRTLTDNNGQYRLTVPARAAYMTVWARHYAPQRRSITVPAGEVIIEDFLLRAADETLPPGPPTPD